MITTVLILAGMLLLWLTVSTNASATVRANITNQLTDAVESRAAITSGYVASAEEYVKAFALSSEVRELLQDPEDPGAFGKGPAVHRGLCLCQWSF